MGNCRILFSIAGGKAALEPGEATALPPPSKKARLRNEEIILKEQEGVESGWMLVQMNESHLDQCMEIQAQCFEPHHREDRQAYVDRMKLYPQGAIVLLAKDPKAMNAPGASKSEHREDGYCVAAYILFQPFFKGEIYEDGDTEYLINVLNQPDRWDCIYTHELSVSTAFRGKGLTYPLTEYAEQFAGEAMGYSCMTLVALSTAEPFWRKNGYQNLQQIDYGGVPCYRMEKSLARIS